jgi:hypothetical protein
VATHQKASRDWEAVVSREHNPPNVEAFLASTREGLLKSAGRIGPHVQAVIQHLLQRKVTDGLKPSRAILRLAKQVGQVRLDAACERALYYDNIEYGTVKRILNARLESTPLATAEQSSGNYCFQFSRPPGYFAPQPNRARRHTHERSIPTQTETGPSNYQAFWKPWNSALPRPWRKNGNTPSSS